MTTQSSALTIVGLGPGGARYLTIEARQVLRWAAEIWMRTKRHPVGKSLLRDDRVRSFDDVYEQAESFEAVYETIAAKMLDMARQVDGIVYAVPGHPLVGEESVRRILRAAPAAGVSVRIVAGLSFLEPVCSMLGLDPLEDGFQMIDATTLAGNVDGGEDRWHRLLAPMQLRATCPALVCQLYDRRVAAGVKLALLEYYPAQHTVTLLRAAGVPGQERKTIFALGELDRQRGIDHLTCLYLPPLALVDDVRSFETFRHIVARLRAPGGCPWDREQTHQSLKPYVIEECYEVLQALDDADPAQLEEELGDLLLQVVLHAQLAAEADDFVMADVLEHISAKLIRRHPHVFGDVSVSDASEVLRNWERIKHAEKSGQIEAASLLGGVPREMPALAQARSIQRRVAGLGFKWADARSAIDKVAEEAAELRQADDVGERRQEFGDLLFALVSAGGELGLEAEEALRMANDRFARRFRALEAIARERDIALKGLPAGELERLWRESKLRLND